MKNKKVRILIASLLAFSTLCSICLSALISEPMSLTSRKTTDSDEPIKWVEFDVPYNVLKRAMDIDIETWEKNPHIDWVDILAYLGARYGGDFSLYQAAHMDDFIADLKNGKSVAALTKDMKYFSYYSRAYDAVLGGMLGEYQVRIPSESSEDSAGNNTGSNASGSTVSADSASGEYTWKKVYGLKAFSPIAEGFAYSDYDDFGQNRSYGYSRRHLGHDMIVSVGTPVIAVESGTVEALGWNQYGGWRIGIRSHDKQRYYYYAHLRKDSPYASDLQVGAEVTAGDVIGYAGQTGYSVRENVNNIDTPHLHIGMQLIFDEDAKDGVNQIWIDLYSITKLLSEHRSTVVRSNNGEEYERKYLFYEENYLLNELQAAAEVTQQDEVDLPVLMYHSLLKDTSKQGKYVVSPELFEQDLKYIRKKGYTPVFMKDVIAYVEGNGDLPKKPIVISFDDGYFNNYYYAFPLLKKYNMKAVISVVGKLSDDFTQTPDENPNYAHLTWDHILEMHLSGYWEIQNHSYNCHTYTGRNGVAQTSSESDEAYRSFLTSDIYHLQDKIAYVTGVAPNTFTYPFGAFSENTDEILKSMGFKATLSCTEGVSTIRRGDSNCLYQIKRHLRPADTSPKEFFTFLD